MNYQDLREYQQRAVDYLYDHDSALLLAEMGAGKTVITATAVSELLNDGHLNKVLIVAPHRVCQLVWPQEVAKWAHLDNNLFDFAVGSTKHRAGVFEHSSAKAIVVNYENLAWMVEKGYHEDFDGVVWDEITRMKNVKSKQVKAWFNRIRKIKWKVGLTGTFPGDDLEDVFGQVYAVDGGVRFGKWLHLFQDEYFYTLDEAGRMLKPKRNSAERIKRLVDDLVFRLKAEEYKDQLPDLVTNRVDVRLPTYARDKYEQLEAEFTLEELGIWDENGELDILGDATVRAKLQQLADGFVYTDDGEEQATFVHNAKEDAFEEVMDSADSPVLCVYKYRAELFRLKKRWPGPYLGGGVSRKDAAKAVEDWNAGKLKVLYLHPDSAGHGLNLQFGGHTLVWYGLPWSKDKYNQTVARLHRDGQEHTVFVHQIVALNTVDDEYILPTLAEKQRVEEVFK